LGAVEAFLLVVVTDALQMANVLAEWAVQELGAVNLPECLGLGTLNGLDDVYGVKYLSTETDWLQLREEAFYLIVLFEFLPEIEWYIIVLKPIKRLE
jgi:hypothetical protein